MGINVNKIFSKRLEKGNVACTFYYLYDEERPLKTPNTGECLGLFLSSSVDGDKSCG